MTALPLLTALFALTAAADRPDLTGHIKAKDGGPVANASVFIDTAGPRQGTSPLCPSCYADCSKHTETDAAGAFTIRALDPELIFRVLVVAQGYKPTFATKVDPATGPLDVALESFDPSKLDPRLVLRGKVLNPEGQPVVGAILTAEMFSTDAFSGYSPDIFDPLAITNLDGTFTLASKSPIHDATVKVEGRGLAPRAFPDLHPTDPDLTLRLTRGAEVTGRVVHDGKPVPGVTLGLVQVNRGIGQYLGHVEIATDQDGRFRFSNVGPNDRYLVYGIMDSLKDHGAIPARELTIGADETTTDAGDLAVAPGHKLAGKVVLSDGQPIPPKTQVLVSREGAWDLQRTTLDEQGRFEMTGLPTERYNVNVNVKGYHLSEKNKTRNPQNPWSLTGTVDRDILNLTILLDPGEK